MEVMANRLEENLSCPVCKEIFQDPVILTCTHSFCNECLESWWAQKTTLECPLCKRQSSQRNPPLNLALKTLCEDFLQERNETPPRGPSPDMNHRVSPVDEAAQDCKQIIQELLMQLQNKAELLKDIKRTFDQTAKDIEVQAHDTERQIKDVFSILREFLKNEEQTRLDALTEEKKQKSQMIKMKTEALSVDIAALLGTISDTEEVLRADAFSLPQSYEAAAEEAQFSLLAEPQQIPEGLTDMTKHLDNLSLNILDNMKKEVTFTAGAGRVEDDLSTDGDTRSWFTVACSGAEHSRLEINPFAFDDESDEEEFMYPGVARLRHKYLDSVRRANAREFHDV